MTPPSSSVIISVYLFASCAASHAINETLLRPNLPLGPYKVTVRSILPCDKAGKNKINGYWRLNKVSATRTELEGNFTSAIPFDDTIHVHANFDQKKSNGGWSTSSIMVRKAKACSTLKSIIREEYLKAFGFGNSTCPVPPGIHYTKGLPATNLEIMIKNLPKAFIYGTYRYRLGFISKSNEVLMCFHCIIEILRPWEN